MTKPAYSNLTLSFFFVLFFAASACATPEVTTEAEPDPDYEAEPRPAVIETDLETARLDSVLDELSFKDEPGVLAAVFKQGELIYNSSSGLANLDHNIPLSDSSRFFMAELSKQVTAAAAGVLIHRDSLSLDTRVNDILDDWPQWAEEVRVHHLIHHTSGLPEIYDLIEITDYNMADPIDLDEYVEMLTKAEELNYEPGDEFNYSNSGYKVLTAIIERVADQNLDEFAREVFFDPLGMEDTHFHTNRSRIIPNRVLSYSGSGNNFRQEYMNMFQGYGPVGLYSSLRDWKKWEKMRVDNDPLGKGPEFRELLHQNGQKNNDAEVDYVFGLERSNWKGQLQFTHAGNFMGFSHHLRYFPEYQLTVLVKSNRSGFNAESLTEELAEYLLADELKAWLEPYTGSFYNDELGVTYTITVEYGRLRLDRPHSDQSTLRYGDEDKWRMGSWDFVFDPSDNHKAERFLLSTGRAREVEFVRRDD